MVYIPTLSYALTPYRHGKGRGPPARGVPNGQGGGHGAMMHDADVCMARAEAVMPAAPRAKALLLNMLVSVKEMG